MSGKNKHCLYYCYYYFNNSSESVISRAIYVTDRSLIASDGSNEGVRIDNDY